MRFETHLITEDKATDYLETAALLGITGTADFIKLSRDILKADSKSRGSMTETLDNWLRLLPSQFTEGDWIPRGKSEVLRKTKMDDNSPAVLAIANVCSLAVGMNNFLIHTGIKTPYFVHNQIKRYYDIESETMGDISHAKDNTTDTVICDKPIETLFKSMEQKPEKTDKNYVMFGNVKTFQCSLKKSKTNAQLGKIGSTLRGIIDTETKEKRQNIPDSLRGLVSEDINEGVWDNIKSVATSTWSSFKASFKKALDR
jgi:hypothetical protein